MFRQIAGGAALRCADHGFFRSERTGRGRSGSTASICRGDRALPGRGCGNDFAGGGECVILTTAANGSMEGIHDRMPVVLTRAEAGALGQGRRLCFRVVRRVPPALVHIRA